MATSITPQQQRIPLTEPRSGQITREWIGILNGLIRDSTLSASDVASLQALIAALQAQDVSLQAQIDALEAEVAALPTIDEGALEVFPPIGSLLARIARIERELETVAQAPMRYY